MRSSSGKDESKGNKLNRNDEDGHSNRGTQTGSGGILVKEDLVDLVLESSLDDFRQNSQELAARVELELERKRTPPKVDDQDGDGFKIIPMAKTEDSDTEKETVSRGSGES